MKLNLYIFFLFFLTKTILAQKHDNIWCIGGGGGIQPNKPDIGVSFLDFSNSNSLAKFSPEAKSRLSFNQTCASICDKTGKLAFYSNGVKIENWNHDTIPINKELVRWFTGGATIIQGTLILPFPEKDSIYLILYEEPGFLDKELIVYYAYYSIVDMSKNNGKGEVIELKKKIPKVTDEYFPSFGKLCAIKQPNGIDWWIYTMKYNSNVFYRYALTKDGFSFIDTQTYGKAIVDGVGAANFSPFGKYYARYDNVSVKDGQFLDVYDFDRCTGLFSNQRSIKYKKDVYGAGVAFSPNSRFLYVAIGYDLLQYDMEAKNFAASEKRISRLDTAKVCYGGNLMDYYNCQLAPDGKIYIVAAKSCQKLHVIEKPDLPDTLCQLRQHGVDIPTFVSYSFPSFPNFRLGKAECMMGTKDIEINISLYPNPAQETLYIASNDSTLANMKLEIINTTGQLIATHDLLSPKSTIDVSGLANGIYYCQFKSNNKMLTTKRLIIIK